MTSLDSNIRASLLQDARELLDNGVRHLLRYLTSDQWMEAGDMEVITGDIQASLDLTRAIAFEVARGDEDKVEEEIETLRGECTRFLEDMEKRQERIDVLVRESSDLEVALDVKDRRISELERQAENTSESESASLSIEDQNMARVVQLMDDCTPVEEWPAEADIRKFESVWIDDWKTPQMFSVPGIVVDATASEGKEFFGGVLYKIGYLREDGILQHRWAWDNSVRSTKAAQMTQENQDRIHEIGYLIDTQEDRSMYPEHPQAPSQSVALAPLTT